MTKSSVAQTKLNPQFSSDTNFHFVFFLLLMDTESKVLRNLILRVDDLNQYDFEPFFKKRYKTIQKCDSLLTDIQLAQNVSFYYTVIELDNYYSRV